MGWKVLIDREALKYVVSLPEKSREIVRKNLKKLGENPYLGGGKGDKEKLTYRGKILYRFHIGRSFTAFYLVYEDKHKVKILKVMTIERAHKEYGRL